MSAHAPASFSKLAAIVQCPAYIRMTRGLPEPPRTPEQTEGDAGHYVACHAVSTGEILPVGAPTPQGVRVTEEMVEGAVMWLEACPPGGTPEMPAFATSIHPTECIGTPDWRQWAPLAGVIRVKDFKFGHRYVEAFENWQLVGAFCGVLDEIDASGLADQHIRCIGEIVQPRYYGGAPVRTWECMASDLRPLINIAREAVAQALEPNAPARVGPECYDCPARHGCATLQAATSYLMTSYAVSGDNNAVQTPGALGAELALLDDAADLIEARRTGLQTQVEQLIRGGQRVPGYGLQSVEGRETWRSDVEPDVIRETAKLFGVTIDKPRTLLTPLQARKAGFDANVSSAYSHRPRSLKLQRDSTITARQAFGANKV